MIDGHELAVMQVFADEDLCEFVSWRTDGEFAPISYYVNCNDLFWWGCADAEPITPEALPVLKGAIADCKAINRVTGAIDAMDLFVCRMRNMRPQGAWYSKDNREYWHLFDACGPEREKDFSNPVKQGDRAK